LLIGGLGVGLLVNEKIGGAIGASQQEAARSPRPSDWPMFGGGPDNNHYSRLSQINRGNVKQLEVAWTFETGDAFEGSEMQCNPIILNGVMYVTSPRMRVIALDAATGMFESAFISSHPS
jgi:glucose dehydrogenase